MIRRAHRLALLAAWVAGCEVDPELERPTGDTGAARVADGGRDLAHMDSGSQDAAVRDAAVAAPDLFRDETDLALGEPDMSSADFQPSDASVAAPADAGCAPSAEMCDTLDNDCDGRIDEGARNRCGACGAEPDEVCNALDDDCDGVTDEQVTNACGGCGPVPEEICNVLDDDCDGVTDEHVTNACGGCDPVPEEICNTLDDDCDGLTDEHVTNACGGCGPVPEEICNALDDDCDGVTDEQVANACGGCGPVPEEICNALDDDCDGVTDEQVANACGGCGPVPEEICNALDDDCDGLTDEHVTNACGGCGPVPEEICNGVDDDCDAWADERLADCCWGRENACGRCESPPTERCTGVDDDCDGQVDEGLAGHPERCNGRDDDCDGVVDEDAVPAAEICNGDDDDCDGVVDEGRCAGAALRARCLDPDQPALRRQIGCADPGGLPELSCPLDQLPAVIAQPLGVLPVTRQNDQFITYAPNGVPGRPDLLGVWFVDGRIVRQDFGLGDFTQVRYSADGEAIEALRYDFFQGQFGCEAQCTTCERCGRVDYPCVPIELCGFGIGLETRTGCGRQGLQAWVTVRQSYWCEGANNCLEAQSRHTTSQFFNAIHDWHDRVITREHLQRQGGEADGFRETCRQEAVTYDDRGRRACLATANCDGSDLQVVRMVYDADCP